VASFVKTLLRTWPNGLLDSAQEETCNGYLELFRSVAVVSDAQQVRAMLITGLESLQQKVHPLQIATFRKLLRCLRNIGLRSYINKMGSRHLAIVFAPSMFPLPPELCGIDRLLQTSSIFIHGMELLIELEWN